MTAEEKDILRKDLCARLVYGVKVCIKLPNHQEKTFEEQIGDLKELTIYGGYLVNSKGIDYRSFNLDIKPYLRPLSSMTKEEESELQILWNEDFVGERIPFYIYPCYKKTLDFYNEHHFDYRGLIEKGLALEAPEGIYKKGE